jgi:RimJ/RimL family protein N-acetyltransferase
MGAERPALARAIPMWDGLRQFADGPRLPDGCALSIRFVRPDDLPALQRYFQSLSQRSRSDRLLGAASGLSRSELEIIARNGDDGRFACIAEVALADGPVLVGEMRYAVTSAGIEFGLSVHDSWQRRGIATAMVVELQCRAAILNAATLFGDTRSGNEAMLALARKLGFRFTRTPGDWTLTRIVRHVPAVGYQPCAVGAGFRAATAMPPF